MSVIFVSILAALAPPHAPPIEIAIAAPVVNASTFPAPTLALSPPDANLRPSAVVNASELPAATVSLSPPTQNLRPTAVGNVSIVSASEVQFLALVATAVQNVSTVNAVSLEEEASIAPVAVVNASTVSAVSLLVDQDIAPAAVLNESAIPAAALDQEPELRPAAVVNASNIPAAALVVDVDLQATAVANVSSVPAVVVEFEESDDGAIAPDGPVLNSSLVKNPTIFGPFIVPVEDPHWANVVLLADANFLTMATNVSAGENRIPGVGLFGQNPGSPRLSTTTKPSHLPAAIEQVSATNNQTIAADPSGKLALGSSQFTIDGWLYSTWAGSTSAIRLLSRWSASPNLSYLLGLSGSSELSPIRFPVFAMSSNGTAITTLRSPDVIAAGQWVHLAVDRDAAGDVRLYVNGVMKAKINFPTLFDPAAYTDIRALGAGANGDGFFQELRVTKGSARYASDAGFTVPSTAVPRGAQGKGDFYWDDVVFLSHLDDGAGVSTHIRDVSKIGHRSDAINAGIVYVDGGKFGRALQLNTAGFFTIPVSTPSVANFNMSGKAFTAECWACRTASNASRSSLLAFWRTTSNLRQWGLTVNNNKPEVLLSTTGANSVIIASVTDLPLNTWAHVAVDRTENGVTRLYVDGVMVAKDVSLAGVALYGTALPTQFDIYAYNGASGSSAVFAGRMDEIRITRGAARYASDAGFTAPNAPFDAFPFVPVATVPVVSPDIEVTPDLVEHVIELPAPEVEDADDAVVTIPESVGTLPVGSRLYFTFTAQRFRLLRFAAANAIVLKGIKDALRRQKVYLEKLASGEWWISGGEELPSAQAAYSRWRIYVTATSAAQGTTTLREVEFSVNSAGADQATGGTATADSTVTGALAPAAFDNSTVTKWSSASTVADHWIAYQFAAPVYVGHVRLTSDSVAADVPTHGFVQFSPDGVYWYNAWEWDAPTFTTAETRGFTAPWST